ncbi:MAG: L-histidine N(alpha)-methyltransferase, partial [Acidimicrobiales bacterium]|nr:L-histidine N(alpha)-methyltransferase [Acidimicrobiales bacterium]
MSATPTIEVHLDAARWRSARAARARDTLTARPRSLDALWFYDEHGSDLFDEITRSPEYYQTRAERALLSAHAHDIADFGADTLVELGSGTSDKTTTLLDAMDAAGNLVRYIPFDVSEETLRAAVEALGERYPDLEFHGVVGDFHHHLGTIPGAERRLVAFLGGTIGNLRPDVRRSFLADLDAVLTPDDALLVGIDLVKDPTVIVAAYDDAAGVTAAFNRNALAVLNRELGGDFDIEAFEHVARWNAHERWIEMRLRARSAQRVRIEGLDLDLELAEGEDILTEISAKFTVEGFSAELDDCGFDVDGTWVAP